MKKTETLMPALWEVAASKGHSFLSINAFKDVTFTQIPPGELIRRFELQRNEDETGISGTGVVAVGVEFPDGTAVLRWNTSWTSTAIYNNIDELEQIHGHNGRTVINWID